MWKDSEIIKLPNRVSQFRLNYTIDTTGGQSGSGILNERNQVVGVHAYASKGRAYNTGVLGAELFYDWVKEGLKNVSAVYDLYNPNTGEHFFTNSKSEWENLKRVGWNDEQVGWFAPVSGSEVYRLNNPNTGEHHYTMNRNEKDGLVNAGWKDEGIAWHSDQKQTTPIYRLYNPNATMGSHFYTSIPAERDNLINAGWKDEGIAWYGL